MLIDVATDNRGWTGEEGKRLPQANMNSHAFQGITIGQIKCILAADEYCRKPPAALCYTDTGSSFVSSDSNVPFKQFLDNLWQLTRTPILRLAMQPSARFYVITSLLTVWSSSGVFLAIVPVQQPISHHRRNETMPQCSHIGSAPRLAHLVERNG